MQVSVTFRHMEPTEALKEFAAEKVARIRKLIHTPTDAEVVLSVERYMHQADITIKAHGVIMRGKEKSEDMYASIDRAMAKIERQVKRYKSKLSAHKAREGKDAKIKLNILEAQREPEAPEPEVTNNGLPPEIIETKEVVAPTLSVDEALMQMDLIHADFFVFINAQSHAINVLYRRNEGTFGLIETPSPDAAAQAA